MKFVRVLCGSGILISASTYASAAFDGATIQKNTPRFTTTARSMGDVEPSTAMSATIWLKPHDKAGLDSLAKSLYNRDSGSYRHFLTHAEFAAKFAPTAAEANLVKQFFVSNHLKVTGIGPNNFYVRASGTAGAFSSAFHVSLKNFEVDGKIVRANTEDPEVSGEAGALVASISGLDTLSYTHPVRSQAIKTAATSSSLPIGIGLAPEEQSFASKPAASAAAAASPFNSTCFTGSGTSTYTTAGALPKAAYTGNQYTGLPQGCGYVPENIYTAYNLKPLYKQDYDGAGQTIVIIDWCGSPTITADANAFSKRFGLPPLTAKNFKIINTPTPSTCAAPDPEINIDVEWAHAIAPGAAIDLVVPPTGSFEDVDEGFFYAVNYGLGNVISGSYGSEELYTPISVLATEDLISETAAVLGIAANFSTGDQGDFTFDSPISPPSVSAPADSPYATGVGGVSLALNADNSIRWTTGWGMNQNPLADLGNLNTEPNLGGQFYGGSGGGESALFTKPLYQEKLKGAYRSLPDISWLGDPFTGVYIAISEPGVVPTIQYTVYGGTSLACPMFSALWAIANQVAGEPLGQAAPYLYAMPKGAITDIVAYGSKTNVTGVLTDTTGKTNFAAADLAAPLNGDSTYFSAVWNPPFYSDTGVLLTFGTDTSLKSGPGWDNATGLGVPNGAAFINAFKPQ